MSYKQLAHEERYQTSVLLKAGLNQTEIAMILGRHKSTISREITRKRIRDRSLIYESSRKNLHYLDKPGFANQTTN